MGDPYALNLELLHRPFMQVRRGEGQTQRSEEGAQTDDRRGEIEEERMEEGENQEGEKPSYREVLQGKKGQGESRRGK